MFLHLALLLGAVMAAASALAQDAPQRAPFITTPDEVVVEMLKLAGAGPEDYVIDLGSGDGRIVITAAQRFGARGLGVDLDEKLVDLSRENARRAGLAERAEFRVQDALNTDLSRAGVVTIYLLPQLIGRLQPRVLDEMRPGARVVTHAFYMQSWKPDEVRKVRLAQRHAGQGDESTIYLWIVPAKARGEWRARLPALGELNLRIHQNFQEIEIESSGDGGGFRVEKATLRGDAITWSGTLERAGRRLEQRFSGRVHPERIEGELTIAGQDSARLVATRAR
ncbi:MAG: methyltransferase domain-containing protein [Betaproteobacteria bacterium]|nr:methyltransferase domain-containing protein [Betaproteobacteria bacterium]